MEMSTREEDKQELKKQLGCMNGIFQLFDRRYLLGQRRQNQKKLTQGKSNDGENKFNYASDKPKEKPANKTVKENHRASVESSRNSFSSSCSSTTFSSLDCSKRVQTEHSSFCQSIGSEPSSPTLQKQPDFSPDIRDVVKDSMTRKPRAVPVKPVVKDERKGPVMTHVDSPRPVGNPKGVSSDRKDRKLVKLLEASKDVARFSCDERESLYKLKSIGNVKELPRFSLDSKQSSIRKNDLRRVLLVREIELGGAVRPSAQPSDQPHEPGPIARLMGLEPAPWRQDGGGAGGHGCRKEVKGKKVVDSGSNAAHSVYGEIEKRLTEIEFKTSGKDLRALKQILEAMQRTRMRLEIENTVQPVSPTVRKVTKTVKPANLGSDLTKITGAQKVKKVNHLDNRKHSVNKRRNLTNSPGFSPRLQGSKNGTIRGPLSDLKRVRKPSKGLPIVPDPKSRNSKTKPVNPLQNNEKPSTDAIDRRNLRQLASDNEPEGTNMDWTRENASFYLQNENEKKKIAERLTEYKPVAELAMLTLEQPSPVSVLDAFYTEDTPSPVKKKSYAFNDEEDLQFNEPEWNPVEIDTLVSTTKPDHSNSEFHHTKMENENHPFRQIESPNSESDQLTLNHTSSSDGDQEYIAEILLASSFLKNLNSATMIVHLHPTDTLINPELFHILEKTKTKTKTNPPSKSNEKIRRKMLFDTLNDILVEKLASSKGKILNREKLVMEICSEMNNLEENPITGLYDEIINIISLDVNKKSENWDDYCNEVPVLVLDIERLIFKDLISEIASVEVAGRRCRQLFPV